MRLTAKLDDITPTPPGPCALQQHPRYGQAMRAIGATSACLSWHSGQEVVATAQILRRRFGPLPLSWLGRGPVLRPDMSLRDVLPGIQDLGSSILIPDTPDTANTYGTNGYRAVLTPQHVAELDLTASSDARLSRQHGKWRNRLRAADAACLPVEMRAFDAARDAGLLDLERAQRRHRGYSALPGAFTQAFAAFAPDTTLLCFVPGAHEPLAFMLFLLHPPVATYHIGWTRPEGRACHAHNLLLWQASTHLADRGFTRLDLGTIDTETAPGLARFKLGCGARARALGPTLLRLARSARQRPAA